MGGPNVLLHTVLCNITYLTESDAPQDKLKKLKSAQILRSLAQKTEFSLAAVEVVDPTLRSQTSTCPFWLRCPDMLLSSLVFHTAYCTPQAKNIDALRAFVKEHQRDYVQSGVQTSPCCTVACNNELKYQCSLRYLANKISCKPMLETSI